MAGKSPKEKFIDCVWERMEDYDEEEQVARATCSYLTSSTAPPLPPLSSPSPSTSSSRDHRRLLESRCLSAWKDVKTEIKEKFVRWSPENPHFNDLTANSLASDAFDDAGLIAQDYMGAIK